MKSGAFTFPRSHRLASKAQFQAVYDARIRETRGPLTISFLPNDLGHPRLGVSVAKRVGSAPKRNHIKRLLRESFRLMQYDFPRGYDVLINVRPHEAMELVEYQNILGGAIIRLHGTWEKNESKK